MPPKPDFLDLIGQGLNSGIDAYRQQERDKSSLLLALQKLGQEERQFQGNQALGRQKLRQDALIELGKRKDQQAVDQSLIELRRAQTEANDALAANRRNQNAQKVTRKEFMMESNRLFNVYLTEERKKFTTTNPNDPMNLLGGNKAAPVPENRIRELQAQARRETIKTLMPEEWAKRQAEAEAIKARVRGSVPGAQPAPVPQQQTFNRNANPIFQNLPEAEPGDSTFETAFGPMTREQMAQALMDAQIEGVDINDPELQQDFEFVFGPAGE